MKKLLVTGGAGFIGSNFCDYVAEKTDWQLIVLDALTYCGDTINLESLIKKERVAFEKASICDAEAVRAILAKYEPDGLVHFAAESHVDRSISDSASFIETNINGTFQLLNCTKPYLAGQPEDKRAQFRFVHVSTDEVFGSLGHEGYFSEKTPYSPRSPYSASKAASDHLVEAWVHTYQFPAVVTHCSNNYGPRQFPEKLIPATISRALNGEKLAVYGKGENIRDWIHVSDHCQGIFLALTRGKIGNHYCLGGEAERQNLYMVEQICEHLDTLLPRPNGAKYAEQIAFVTDRLGHDFRYAIDNSFAKKELGYENQVKFEDGLKSTIEWYLENQGWIRHMLNKA